MPSSSLSSGGSNPRRGISALDDPSVGHDTIEMGAAAVRHLPYDRSGAGVQRCQPKARPVYEGCIRGRSRVRIDDQWHQTGMRRRNLPLLSGQKTSPCFTTRCRTPYTTIRTSSVGSCATGRRAYYNPRLDLSVLSRHEDVSACLRNHDQLVNTTGDDVGRHPCPVRPRSTW